MHSRDVIDVEVFLVKDQARYFFGSTAASHDFEQYRPVAVQYFIDSFDSSFGVLSQPGVVVVFAFDGAEFLIGATDQLFPADQTLLLHRLGVLTVVNLLREPIFTLVRVLISRLWSNAGDYSERIHRIVQSRHGVSVASAKAPVSGNPISHRVRIQDSSPSSSFRV
jgi:hypothetical protein